MRGYLLDTSIASVLEPSRIAYATPFVEWTRDQNERLYISTITLFEVSQGIAKLRRTGASQRASDIAAWRDILSAAFEGRTLEVSNAVAEAGGHISDGAFAKGRHPGLADIFIAATAQVHDLTLLTRNIRHFEPLGIDVVDPLVRLPD